MAEALKNQFGAAIPTRIARMISGTGFPLVEDRFLAEVLEGYEPLGLMQRARRIAHVLRRHLPTDYPAALEVLLASVDAEPPAPREGSLGMSSFLYLPHTLFVAEYGLEHFEPSMQAQDRLTQLFTAEFSIRPFLERFPEATVARLQDWTGDPSPHVRTVPRTVYEPRRSRRSEVLPKPASICGSLNQAPGLPPVGDSSFTQKSLAVRFTCRTATHETSETDVAFIKGVDGKRSPQQYLPCIRSRYEPPRFASPVTRLSRPSP